MSEELPENPKDRIRALFAARPELVRVRETLAGRGAHLVGGALRDLLMGLDPDELDIAIEGNAVALARELDPEATVHERFGTASIVLGGMPLDLAGTRTETYSRDGALPDVEPASIDEDLARRDFSVNAMALSLDGELRLRDPFDGVADIRARLLRVLHEDSLADDPTRALRAARYAARLGFEVEPLTLEQIRRAPLDSVSANRISSDLQRTALEPDPVPALGLLADWGLAAIDGDLGLVSAVAGMVDRGELTGISRADAVLGAARIRCGAFEADPAKLGRARERADATGELEIRGQDLLEAGVEPGPAVGAGLAAALEAKLAGEAEDRATQLRIALAAARG